MNESPLYAVATIMVNWLPMECNSEALTSDAPPDEALDKVHQFFHLRYHLPVCWLVCYRSLQRYQQKLRQWRDEFGDEIGIYETGVAFADTVKPGLQPWMEDGGFQRPTGQNRHGGLGWSEIPEADQYRYLRFLKDRYDQLLDQDTQLVYGASAGATTVRAMQQAGLSILWGYNWNLYGDGVDSTGKGCPAYPFYVSESHAKAPTFRSDNAVLGVPWGSGDMLNNYCTARQSRIAMNRCCLNAHELANRSGAVPKHHFIERFLKQLNETRAWNPFAYVPLQIEAIWLSENGGFFGHHPCFNSRTTEMFFHLVESAMRHGAQFTTHEHFAHWYRENLPETPEMLFYCEDLVADVDFCGKDQNFSPMVVWSERKQQRIFLRSAGFNPVRTYRYDPVVAEADARMEYPYEGEPEVELLVKEWTTPSFGIHLTHGRASYQSESWNLTAHKDQFDYAAILWEVNLPQYVSVANLEHSAQIKRIRLLPEKNIALIEADLTRGDHELFLRSRLPEKYISVEEPRRSGRRIELYIHNHGPEVGLTRLETNIGKGLQLGGLWIDGEWFDSINYFMHSNYQWQTGEVQLRAAYPQSIPLRNGATRISFEVLGNL